MSTKNRVVDREALAKPDACRLNGLSENQHLVSSSGCSILSHRSWMKGGGPCQRILSWVLVLAGSWAEATGNGCFIVRLPHEVTSCPAPKARPVMGHSSLECGLPPKHGWRSAVTDSANSNIGSNTSAPQSCPFSGTQDTPVSLP
jgi:hypothetical protein